MAGDSLRLCRLCRRKSRSTRHTCLPPCHRPSLAAPCLLTLAISVDWQTGVASHGTQMEIFRKYSRGGGGFMTPFSIRSITCNEYWQQRCFRTSGNPLLVNCMMRVWSGFEVEVMAGLPTAGSLAVEEPNCDAGLQGCAAVSTLLRRSIFFSWPFLGSLPGAASVSRK